MRALIFAVPPLLLLACSSSSSPADAGERDSSSPTHDAASSSRDAALYDAGNLDTGSIEAGNHDAALHEAGGADGSAHDAETKDTGTSVEAGAPISTPDDVWTWVDFPGSKCASGTATGIAVNPHAGATDLLIYFEGGGSCYSAETCWGPTPAANNLAKYDATTFSTARQVGYPTLVRSTSGNPFAAMNMVYVPYCTGDLHFGTATQTFTVDGGARPTYFWGATNMALFLARIVPTFSSPSRVVSLGTSAGGYGSFLDYDMIVKAYGGSVRVDIVDDSGPPLVRVGESDNSTLFTEWGVVPPSGCAGCKSFLDVMKFDRAEQPSSKLAFLSLAEDTVISVDYGYTLENYGAAIENLFSTNFASDPNVATYIVGDLPGHVVEAQPSLEPDYMPWLSKLVSGSAAWIDTTIDGGNPDGG